MSALPEFRYHPDPVASGSVVASDDPCDVCGRASGHRYVGPIYSAEATNAVVCVRCIADGSAAEQWNATFTDAHPWAADVPDQVAAEVLTRTPGFSAWQQAQWMAHCGDAAIFVGPVGARELSGLPPDAAEALRADVASTGTWSAADVDRYMESLDRDGMPTGYLFQCRTCGTYLGFTDST